MGIKAIGIDKDKEAIEGARKNLDWFNVPQRYINYMNNDSSKVKISPVNVLG